MWDFLFTYYSLRPRQLLRWHPGYGVALAGAAARRATWAAPATSARSARDGVTVGADYLLRRLDTVRFIAELLAATAARPAQLNCFGLHEWAMVYRSAEVRHDAVPLRLGSAGTDAVVESMPLRCSHFDAYRFFTARRRHATPSSPDPGDAGRSGSSRAVVHANMDLYKWCATSWARWSIPICCSTAWNWPPRPANWICGPARTTCRDYGFAPIRIEAAGGPGRIRALPG